MKDDFKFLMLSAMYENGGNTTHRFLDSHPQLYVYPFESQLGTRFVNDQFLSMFPVKYRWPVFPLECLADQDYKLIIDEECKVRARTPQVSKFRRFKFDFSDDDRCQIYEGYIKRWGRSRPNNVHAFFRSTFDAWKNYKKTGKEEYYVGYSPIIVIDANKILEEIPTAHFLHVVRNPWSAYADTKKRPVPLSLEHYMTCWNCNQYFALLYQKKYPDRMHILRLEDILKAPVKFLGTVLKKLKLEAADSLKAASFNAVALEKVAPWGTIREAAEEANLETAKELSKEEIKDVTQWTSQYLDVFNYHQLMM